MLALAFVVVGGMGSVLVGVSPVSDGEGVVYAQNFDRLEIPKPSTLPGPTGEGQNKTYLRDVLIVSITRILISLVGGLALLFFIIGGVRMLIAYGDENTLTESKKMLIYSVVGFLIAIFSYAIVTIIGNIQLDAPANQQTQTSLFGDTIQK